jgi:hypothetical protein
VHRLALFHHDPVHNDDDLDLILRDAQDHACHMNAPEVVAAYEGLELALSPVVPRA